MIDDKVFKSSDLMQMHSIALSKEAFISLIENDASYAEDFDFDNFNQLLDVIKIIIDLPIN